ncbi:MAG TPA: WG repeat-containing protein [Hyphomicrobiaceae bacterium]
MKKRAALNVWCTLAILAAWFALLAHPNGAAAEEPLYPHAEREFGPWGYIDKTGRIVIPLQFESASPFSEGLATVKVGKKIGVIDQAGRHVIEPRFDAVYRFQSGRAAVKVGSYWGFIDTSGAEIIPLRYHFTGHYSSDRTSVLVNGRVGALNLTGQMVIPPEFEMIGTFSEGLAPAKRNGKHGYIDKDGKVAIPFQFERAFGFQNGRALALGDASGRSGLINKGGAFVISFDHKMVFEFSEGLAVFVDKGGVNKGGGFGVMDAEGQIVIPPRFTNVGSLEQELDFRKATVFSEGLLPVSEGKSFGYIDRHGAYVIQPQFWSASAFRDGVAVVHVAYPAAKTHLPGLIDRTGKFVAPAVFDWIQRHAGGLSQVKFGDRLGYIDAGGRPLTFPAKELDDYVAAKREQLKPLSPPAPGRAVVAKAGDTEYYLRLPDSLCPLDDSQPADRKFIGDRWAESDKGFEARKALKPMTSDVEQTLRKNAEDYKLKARYVFSCDQLEKLRAGADSKIIDSYVVATGTQKDRYDPSMGAGAVWANAFICGALQGDVFKWSDGQGKDSTGTVTDAFKRLGAGQVIALRAMAPTLPACFVAVIAPDPRTPGGGSKGPQTAKLMAYAMLSWGDWIVQLQTTSRGASTPDEFFREYERDRATIEAIAKANMKR